MVYKDHVKFALPLPPWASGNRSGVEEGIAFRFHEAWGGRTWVESKILTGSNMTLSKYF